MSAFNFEAFEVSTLPNSRNFEYVPLDGSIKFRQIDANVDYVTATGLVDVSKVDLKQIR